MIGEIVTHRRVRRASCPCRRGIDRIGNLSVCVAHLQLSAGDTLRRDAGGQHALRGNGAVLTTDMLLTATMTIALFALFL